MNWFHRERAPLHRVRLELPRRAALRDRPAAHRHRLQHEPRAPLGGDRRPCSRALDDADVRTAGTTYLMYRGRHRHEPQRDSALTRVASTLMRHPVMGPRELFYADIFASRRTGCRSGLGHARGARPPLGLRLRVPGRARPVRLPAALAARQRLALPQEGTRGASSHRSPRPTCSSRASRTPPAASTRSSPSTR